MPAMRHEVPLLEYDPAPAAHIEPSKLLRAVDMAEHCVVCFFRDVIDAVVRERNARVVSLHNSELGPHPVYEIDVDGRRLAFFHPGVGAPLAAGLLEEVIAVGGRKFVACGGAGSLVREVTLGHVIVPTSAVRDEGTSYHYLPASREVSPHPAAVESIRHVLERHGVPHALGKTWTTDAFYRETPGKIALRREEGCVVVEMEASAFFAVAQFRGVTFGQILYGGDDLSGAEWDSRMWNRQTGLREKLFWLAAEAVLRL